jgi:ribose-phosphate pyrophosphokinase
LLPTDNLILCGSSNLALGEKVAASLNVKLAKTKLKRFADGECNVEILEPISGKKIFII